MRALLAELHSNLETVRQAVRPPHRVSVPFSSLPLAEREAIIARDDEHLEDAWHQNAAVRDDWYDEETE